MKKHGILQHELAGLVASLGHTDAIVVADAGLPIPPGVQLIDLAVTDGVPPFLPVLQVILDEANFERAVIAHETRGKSGEFHTRLLAALGDIAVQEVSHEELKQRTRQVRAIIRTGEFTPYANVILFSGVAF